MVFIMARALSLSVLEGGLFSKVFNTFYNGQGCDPERFEGG